MKIIKGILLSLLGLSLILVLTFLLAYKHPVAAQTPSMTNIKHVFIILLENHDLTALNPSAAPYINNTLFKIGAHASNYHNVPTSMGSLHPSEPNYVFLEGGTNSFSDFTFTNDNNSSAANSTGSTAHLATLLNNAGLSWKEYAEGLTPNSCPITGSGIAPKHDPFVFFKDVSGNPPSATNSFCISHHSPLTTTILQNDLANGNVANYNFITPNLCNDMHDCSVTTGDTWLSTMVPIILNSNVFKQDGALFITMDEGGSGNAPIQMIILSPFAKVNYTNNIEYSHASFVKSVERIFNLNPLIGHAADSTTQDLSDFFGTSNQIPAPTPTPVGSTPPTPTSVPVRTPTPTACPNIPTNLGVATFTANAAVAGTYKVWSRIMASSSIVNSYYLQVDNTCPILVGGSTLPSNTWTWINYQNGNTGSAINVSLTAGSHQIKLIGKTANTKVDRLIITNNLSCSPTGTGDNCAGSATINPAADVNGDGRVNIVDIGIIIDNYAKSPPLNPKADVNGDGSVNIVDIGIVIDNYGL